jgi:acetyl-CoA carboxylase biotin carboxyl carrier protein
VGVVTEPAEDPAITLPDMPVSAIPEAPAELPAELPPAAELPAELPPAELPAELPPVADPPPIEVVDPGDASLLALIDRLAAMLDRTELTELEVQVGKTGLVLRKPAAFTPVVEPAAAAPAPGAAGETAAGDAARADAGPPARPSVKAPLTGIWYGSPAPGSSPYVSAGGEVAVGQVIGLIEAMKLFNEIKSDMAGRVVKVHAEDGKLVKAKQSLIEVEPL